MEIKEHTEKEAFMELQANTLYRDQDGRRYYFNESEIQKYRDWVSHGGKEPSIYHARGKGGGYLKPQ